MYVVEPQAADGQVVDPDLVVLGAELEFALRGEDAPFKERLARAAEQSIPRLTAQAPNETMLTAL